MKNPVIYLLILWCCRASGRVANNSHIPDITSNLIIPNDKTITEVLTTETPKKDTIENEVTNKDDNNIESVTPVTTEQTLKEITDNSIETDGHEPCKLDFKIDNGSALILTPLLKENCIKEARIASKVDPSLFLGFKSYSGFLTVNETYGSNLFFWYFPNQKLPVNETPWLIWLQGGPGATSMTGLFDEIGPFYVDSNGDLYPNLNTWLKDHSIVFIDNPVGTGYSFTNDFNGLTTNMDMYGDHLYTALKQFLQIFPELRTAPLYVAGESYGGKYVPSLAIRIHRYRSEELINLKGLIIGNGYVDPAVLSKMASPFVYFGLLEPEQIDLIRPLMDSFQQDLATKNSADAKIKWNHLITVLLLLTKQNHAYNFLRDDVPVGRFLTFLKRPEVKKALHVGDLKMSFVNKTVNSMLESDFLSNARPLYEELLEKYRVMHYCGQLDQIMSCVLSSENYRTWRWSGSGEFLAATRYPFLLRGRLAGYHKTGGHLTEVVLRGAGHMAPLDAPAQAQQLVSKWTHEETLGEPPSRLDESFLQYYVNNSTISYYL